MTPQHQRRTQARAKRQLVEHQIMQAVADLLTQRPFHEITVDDVMRSTGLTRTAFYRYFPDLETVLVRLVAQLRAEIRQERGSRFTDAPLDADLYEVGRRGFATVAAAFRERGPLLRAVTNVNAVALEAHQAWVEIQDELIDEVAARIRELKEARLSAVTNSAITARALVLMVVNVLLELDTDDAEVWDAAVASLTEIAARAIFATDDRPHFAPQT
jgi:AcrR family transcriptional regulator